GYPPRRPTAPPADSTRQAQDVPRTRMPTLKERRISPRLDAVRNNRSRIELGTPSGPRRADAVLVNISREGALIVAVEPPRPYQRIWLRMEEPAKTDWVAAV